MRLVKVPYTDEVTLIEAANLNEIQDAIIDLEDDRETMADNTADIYESTQTYAVGDYCIHEYILYKCTTAISAPEAWTPAHWEMVVIMPVVQELQAQVNAIGFHNVIKVSLPGINSLPKTFNVAGMTVDHESLMDGVGLVTPSGSMGNDWTLVPGNGTLQVTGTFSGSTTTTISVTMGIPDNKVTGVAQ